MIYNTKYIIQNELYNVYIYKYISIKYYIMHNHKEITVDGNSLAPFDRWYSNYRFLTIQGAAGFLPSAVLQLLFKNPFTESFPKCCSGQTI